MNEGYLALCDRILERCQEQCWYGGNEHNTLQFCERDQRYEEFIDAQGNLLVVDNDPDDHPLKTSFAYPPATEDQLLATEQELGFALPPLLRVLYSRLANGGFGPGYGLIGALGGFDEAGNLVDMYQYHARRVQLVDLVEYQQDIRVGEPFELSDVVWPRSMLYLCDWGEANISCIDRITGQIFFVRTGVKYRKYILELQAFSLQEWLEQWLEEKRRMKPEQKHRQKDFSFADSFDPFLDEDEEM